MKNNKENITTPTPSNLAPSDKKTHYKIIGIAAIVLIILTVITIIAYNFMNFTAVVTDKNIIETKDSWTIWKTYEVQLNNTKECLVEQQTYDGLEIGEEYKFTRKFPLYNYIEVKYN